MRVTFVGRNVVCLTAMPPDALDLGPFGRLAGASRPRTQITNPQVAVVEYDRLKIVLTPDGRLQLDLPADSRRDLSRRAAAEVVRQASPYALRALGLNGVVRVELEEEDSDPISPLLQEDAIASRLGQTPSRRGLKLIYPLAAARMTLDMLPSADEERVWVGSLNRHFASLPDEAELRSALDWFADLRDELVALVNRMIGVSRDEQSENAA